MVTYILVMPLSLLYCLCVQRLGDLKMRIVYCGVLSYM